MEVTESRTKTDWAEVVRRLVDEDYPDRELIVLVLDRARWPNRLSGVRLCPAPSRHQAGCVTDGDFYSD